MRLDICYQTTGFHAWGVSGGWENAARKLGVLGRVFRPRAEWDAPVLPGQNDDGLFEYLGHSDADAMLLCGFDWHSQSLHNKHYWRDRWHNRKLLTIATAHECITSDKVLSGSDRAWAALESANPFVNLWVYNAIQDKEIFDRTYTMSLWQPFGVDTSVFTPIVPFESRKPMPWFRGKVEFDFAPGKPVYQDRRRLVKHLVDRGLLEVERFDFKPLPPEALVAQYNARQIAVNFPSVFPGHPTRVTEALACGCCLVTNRTGVPQLDGMFQHLHDLEYYNLDQPGLRFRIEHLMSYPDEARIIAKNGADAVQKYSLETLLKQIIEAVEKL